MQKQEQMIRIFRTVVSLKEAQRITPDEYKIYYNDQFMQNT